MQFISPQDETRVAPSKNIANTHNTCNQNIDLNHTKTVSMNFSNLQNCVINVYNKSTE